MISVHVYPSTFEYETRMLKVTEALVSETKIEKVIVIAQAADSLPRRQSLDAQREVWRVPTALKGQNFWAKMARFGEWTARVLWALRKQKVDVVNCHSLSSLPICVALAGLHKAILVYEPHELETGTATFTGLRQRLARWLESLLIGRASEVIVVSDTIAQHYLDDYRLPRRPDVILNVPPLSGSLPEPNSLLRKRFDIGENDLVFMYQGVLDEERGCRLLLDAFRAVPAGKHLVFLGFGPMQEEIAAAAGGMPNVHFHPAVPPDQVLHYTSGADVGFALLTDSCENHRCALPNKLFHYLHAGLPVIVSDLPEMGGLVDRLRCGWRSANTVEALRECVAAIDAASRTKAIEGAIASRAQYNWDNETSKLKAIYARLLGSES